MKSDASINKMDELIGGFAILIILTVATVLGALTYKQQFIDQGIHMSDTADIVVSQEVQNND